MSVVSEEKSQAFGTESLSSGEKSRLFGTPEYYHHKLHREFKHCYLERFELFHPINLRVQARKDFAETAETVKIQDLTLGGIIVWYERGDDYN